MINFWPTYIWEPIYICNLIITVILFATSKIFHNNLWYVMLYPIFIYIEEIKTKIPKFLMSNHIKIPASHSLNFSFYFPDRQTTIMDKEWRDYWNLIDFLYNLQKKKPTD